MNPLVKYSLARLVLFVAALAVVAYAGDAGRLRWWSILLAAVISMLLAYVLLRPLREQAAEHLQNRVQSRLKDGPHGVGSGDELAEDAEVEQQLRSPQGQADPQ